MPIASDEDVMGGEPRIDGTRIAVRHVAGAVIERGHAPAYVADQLELSMSAIDEALAYYDDHPEEIRAYEREHAAAFERAADDALLPTEPLS